MGSGVKNRAPVVVVGTIFVDLKCFPQNELNFKGRNPGMAHFFHGGVGGNVAETMALLGSGVRFSSSVQENGVGHEVLERLNQSGVDIDGVKMVTAPDGHGMWGMEQVVVTVGAQGSVAAARDLDPVPVSALQVEVVDTTGAGDAFVAGLSHALANGAGLQLAVQVGARVAAWTVGVEESVCLDMSKRLASDPWEGWMEIQGLRV
jgi:sugar/nucleoside kinase (ribokinase family)